MVRGPSKDYKGMGRRNEYLHWWKGHANDGLTQMYCNIDQKKDLIPKRRKLEINVRCQMSRLAKESMGSELAQRVMSTSRLGSLVARIEASMHAATAKVKIVL
jgi:hypothetical protein